MGYRYRVSCALNMIMNIQLQYTFFGRCIRLILQLYVVTDMALILPSGELNWLGRKDDIDIYSENDQKL